MTKISASEHLREKVTGRIFTITVVSNFMEAIRKILFDFLSEKTAKNFSKHQSSFKKCLFWFSETLKRIFFSWHFPFEEIFKCHNKNLSGAKHNNYFNVGGLETGEAIIPSSLKLLHF
jgi:hypothetical protein